MPKNLGHTLFQTQVPYGSDPAVQLPLADWLIPEPPIHPINKSFGPTAHGLSKTK